jgi:hypothetical protein
LSSVRCYHGLPALPQRRPLAAFPKLCTPATTRAVAVTTAPLLVLVLVVTQVSAVLGVWLASTRLAGFDTP